MDTDVVLCMFLTVFGLQDLTCGKVSKYLTLAAFIAGIFLRGTGMAAGILAGALFFPLFLVRMIGAADVKAVAVIVGFLGLSRGLEAVGTGFFLGAVWSLERLLRGGMMARRLSYFFAYIGRMITWNTYEPYYRADRDGKEAAIPLVFCLAVGTILRLAAGHMG